MLLNRSVLYIVYYLQLSSAHSPHTVSSPVYMKDLSSVFSTVYWNNARRVREHIHAHSSIARACVAPEHMVHEFRHETFLNYSTLACLHAAIDAKSRTFRRDHIACSRTFIVCKQLITLPRALSDCVMASAWQPSSWFLLDI